MRMLSVSLGPSLGLGSYIPACEGQAHIFIGVRLNEKARVETPGGRWLARPIVVAHDNTPVVRLEVELEDVPDIRSGVGRVEEGRISYCSDCDSLSPGRQ